MTHQRKQGFTLLELSMVIALMTFIIGGIVIGHNMIRSAELRSVVSEVARYTQAVSDFRDKFRALPGDFSGATALWGTAGGDPGGCIGVIGVGSQTCDGNGDGRITTQDSISPLTQYERFRAWQHLAIAAMIEGYFSGVPGDIGPQDSVLEFNVPKSKLNGGGYDLISMTANEAVMTNHYFPINYMHILQFGADNGNTRPSSMIAPILTVDEARSIDTKQDDGLPGSGRIIAPRKGSDFAPDCADDDIAELAKYDVSQEDGRNCSLIFMLGF
jgi:prepilin-type N-terminal cleavage/methylation domain-containing protein